MAERQHSRAQPVAARKRAAKAAKPDAGPPPIADTADVSRRAVSNDSHAAQIKALEDERERLRFELDTARERIAHLERTSHEVLDRIAAVIRSLHSLPKD